MKFSCDHCGATADKPAGHVNRARRSDMRLFCTRRCAGLARRNHKTKAQKVEEKKVYDATYGRKNLAPLRLKKAAYHQATYDPEKARVERRKRAKFHAEYCRRPSYKLWKREYDRRYRAQEYGPFADAYELTLALNREIKSRSTNYEIGQQNQTNNKTQKRAREGGEQDRGRRHSAAHG